jgi:hypothetical protein
MIGRLTNKAPEPPDTASANAERFDVEFSHGGGRYRVVVRSRGTRTGVRTLDDAGATCTSLAEATALTIAVIVDPEGVKLPEPPVATPEAPAPAPPTTPAPVAPVVAPPFVPPTRWSFAIEAKGGVAIGVVRDVAPIGVIALEIRPVSLFSVEIGGLFIPTQRLALERGGVDVWLLAGTANACVWPYAETLRVGACVGLAAGSLRGDGRGYPVESGASRPWFAAMARGAVLGPIIGPLGWTARAELVLPSRRESFGIEGAGVAYEARAASAILAAGLTMTIR